MGESPKSICEQLDIRLNTYQKAVSEKRLLLPEVPPSTDMSSNKSERNIIDDGCSMGKSCTNEAGRVLAACGGESSTPVFGNHLDLGHGGILLTLPSLLACGLLSHIHRFTDVKGYYTAEQVFVSLAFIVLLRVKNLECSQGIPSGELGRCLGLDRIPEVKTLRKRISAFCNQTSVEEWLWSLSGEWMQSTEDLDGVLYVDGHVNLYYGSQVEMPKRFVSRLRLCMSGSTDYWISDRLGQPFFVVPKTLNEGMTKTLIEDIIPRLNRDVPNQPTAEALAENEDLHRYMLIFDRECYSVDFFIHLQQERIAFCTYRKNVREDWPQDAFAEYETVQANGEKESILLAERSTVLYGTKEKGKPQKSITVREIRKLSASGHQTAIITTNKMLEMLQIAVLMFARWCQENFFKYITESFGIDSITSYVKNKLPDTSQIINPVYRALENQQKQIAALITKQKMKYAEMSLSQNNLSEKQMEKHIRKKAATKQDIDELQEKRANIIAQKKATNKKITFSEAYENKILQTSINEQKFFLDTIKIIAYRAETALANMIKKKMATPERARSLIRTIYQSDADIKVDNENKMLHVKIHRSNHWADDDVIDFLCQQLNQTQTVFPDSNLMIQFDLVS